MSLLLITDDQVSKTPDGKLTALLASTRLRLLAAYDGFDAAGIRCWVLARAKPETIIAHDVFRSANTILIGKTEVDHRPTIEAARAAGKRVILDVVDDLNADNSFKVMRDLAAVADAVTVPSDVMAERAKAWVRPECGLPHDGPVQAVLVRNVE